MNLFPSVEDKTVGGNTTQPKISSTAVANFQANSAPAHLLAPFQVHVDLNKARSPSPSSSDSDVKSCTCSSSSQKTAKKSTGWKQPADRPKRPLSAYNIFFQHEREKILLGDSEETSADDESAADTILLHKIISRSKGQGTHKPAKKREHVKTHGKIGFVELAKKVGAKWKGLNDTSRAVYTALAAVEKKRYKKEVDLWNQKRVVRAEQELLKGEKQQALHIQHVMEEGSKNIFDYPECATSISDEQINQCPLIFPEARPTMASSVAGTAKFPVRMSHAELMEKCRADLAANMMRTGISCCDVSVKIGAEKQPSEPCSGDIGAALHQEVKRVGEKDYYYAVDHDSVHCNMHMQTPMHNLETAPSPTVLAVEDDTQESADTAAGESRMEHNAAEREPSVGTSPKHNDLQCFRSESHCAEDPSHPGSSLSSFHSIDKDLTDFLDWAFQDTE